MRNGRKLLQNLEPFSEHKSSVIVSACKGRDISLLFLRFSPEFRSANIFAVAEHTRNQIFLDIQQKFFLQNVHLGPIRWVCILIWDFWVILKITVKHAYAEHSRKRFYRTLSIRRNDFIAHWAYAEWIFAYAQPAEFILQFLHVQLCWAYEEMILSHPEHTRKWFNRWLSIRGNV